MLSKPIRVAMPAGKVGVLASNNQLSRGGNAPQPVVSDGSRLIWWALAVIPMGWLSAVGVIQHLHRNIISSGRSERRTRSRQTLSFHVGFFHALVVGSLRRQLRNW